MTSLRRLRDLAEGTSGPGVYRMSGGALAGTAMSVIVDSGRRCLTIDGTHATNKERFMDACQVGLALPEWFGRNWDALADSLTDLDLGPNGAIIVYGRADVLAVTDPQVWAMAVDVFSDAVAYWRSTPTSLSVVCVGPALPLAPLSQL